MQSVIKGVRTFSFFFKLSGAIGCVLATYVWFRAAGIANSTVEGAPKRHAEPDMNKPVSREEFQLYDSLKSIACLIAMMSVILIGVGMMARWTAWRNNSGVTWRVARKTRCASCLLIVMALCSISTVHFVASTMMKYHNIHQEQAFV